MGKRILKELKNWVGRERPRSAAQEARMRQTRQSGTLSPYLSLMGNSMSALCNRPEKIVPLGSGWPCLFSNIPLYYLRSVFFRGRVFDPRYEVSQR